MVSIIWLQVAIYVSFLFILSAFVVKAIKYTRMPTHLRWELYPVAHETGREYGGSYLEEFEWWTKPRRQSLFGELRYMAREGLLFEKCYRNNRGLWYFTYPFHMGLFLLIGWLVLLFIGVLTMLSSVSVIESANAWARVIYYLTLGVGIVGLALSTFGCIGLLIKRATDENLKLHSAPIDYFNLSFILAILLSGLSSWYFFDTAFATARGFMKGLITFSPVANINPAMTISVILFSLFLIYMPFTHMMHGLAKYFTYHRVRWEDKPNLSGGDIEKRVEELLNQPVSWSAPHIQHGKRWSEIALEAREAK